MHWQSTPYVIPLVVSALICVVLAIHAWRRRPAPGATVFVIMMVAVIEWTLGYAFELASGNLAGIVFWAKVEYLGIVTGPVAALILAIIYTGRESWLSLRRLAFLVAIPVITNLLVWTNDYHGLHWRLVGLARDVPFAMLDVSYGPWFLVHAAYSYIVMLVAIFLVFQAFVRAARPYREQAAVLVLSGAAPLLGNILYISEISPFPYLDLTPFAFALAGLLWAWGLFHFSLLDVVPVARDAVIENMSDAVLVLDAQNRIVDVNPAALQILARPAREVIGQPAPEIFARRPDLVERYIDISEAHAEIILGIEERRFYDLRISTLYDHHKRFAARLIVLRDISQQKEIERELYAAKEAAEHASRAKSVFLANMSHELRTPLTSILGYSELVQLRAQMSGMTETFEDLDRIQSAGKHLLALINDILDLSKIEAGKFDLYLETFDVPTLVGYVASTVRPLVERNSNTLELDYPEDLGSMHADLTRVQQILFNLLSNAAKFTQQGTITLQVRHDGQAMIVFEVCDTGIGMSPEQIKTLFTEFVQADPSTTRKYGGTGLGLALSSRLCQMMGGDIAVESSLGQGSRFVVRLPVVVAIPESIAGRREEPANGIELHNRTV